MSGITSSMGVKRDGVYSDFKCLVVRGVQHADGVYELYFAIEEKLDDKTGAVKASKVLQPPPEAAAPPLVPLPPLQINLSSPTRERAQARLGFVMSQWRTRTMARGSNRIAAAPACGGW